VKVLHVGWGFSPWRDGGLIAYAEDLMDSQSARGDDVAYFFSGRYYPYLSGPRLKRWRRRGVAMHEVINGPLIAGLELGTRHPERDVGEPRLEAGFARVLDAVRPDLVHIQELHGLPSSLIDVAQAAGVATVMTLHDYGPLCATLRLFDADGRLCMRRDVGEDCVARNRGAPTDPAEYVRSTMRFERVRVRGLLGLAPAPQPRFRTPALGGLRAHALRSVRRGDPVELDHESASAARRDELAAAFQRRRDVNVARLGRVGRLIAQSPRLAEIYRTLGVSDEHMVVLPAPARHIEHLRPRRLESAPAPITFATLNGFASPSKGSRLLLAALHTLRAAGLEGRFRLRALGHVDDGVRAELLDYEGVELHGLYPREELDTLLEDVDVGIVPSMWEEAYCYTGLELIAKGIPLIANPLGGIVEYAHEGRTGWLNSSCSADGLAELMARLVGEPEAVVEMHASVVAARDELITPWKEHVDRLDGTYREVLGGAWR
jgi:glycosyltransferase involved in cell wall biosynthesis